MSTISNDTASSTGGGVGSGGRPPRITTTVTTTAAATSTPTSPAMPMATTGTTPTTISPPKPNSTTTAVGSSSVASSPTLSVTGQPIHPTGNNLAAVVSRSVESSPYPSPKQQEEDHPLLLSRQNSDASTNITISSTATNMTNGNEELPNNVSTVAQLATLPDVCLNQSGRDAAQRPLRHVDESGRVSTYALRPMFYSVIFILLVELLERFSFYGVEYTQTSFLTGSYDPDWNAGMSAIAASSYVSISTAVAYTMPFVGAILADSVLGDYWSILFGTIVFYIPGLLLITLSSVPYLLGDTFNHKALSFGLLCMWPCGTGIVKSIVNVFGAKQFHPLLQSSLIESYYVSFYMCINIGALVGGIVVPLVAQQDITLAYTYPLAVLCIGVVLFLLGTPRYVRHAPSGSLFKNFCNSKKKANRNKYYTKPATLSPVPGQSSSSSMVGLITIFRISMLIIPFNIAYSQMATSFIVQGTVMEKAFGWIDAATMNNADALSVLLCGHLVGTYMYPALANRGIKIPTTYKFAIGSTLGACAIAWALLVEYAIHSTYHRTGDKISILWQSASYVLIGAGEIFAVSAAYEVAFTASPPEQKVLASALNLFCVGGLPNVFCIFLYNACRSWFRNSSGVISIHTLEDYSTAHVYLYFLVLLGIATMGVSINLLPCTKRYVTSVEEQAAEMVKTPVMKRPTPTMRRQLNSSSDYASDEESPLLRVKRHQAYLKYGSGPMLYKSGSMRAGPSLSQSSGIGVESGGKNPKKSSKRKLKKSQVGRLYRGGTLSPGPQRHKVILTQQGKPIKAGKLGVGGASKPSHQRQGSM